MRTFSALLVALPLLVAQAQYAPARGTFEYNSRGFFQGDEMEPWTAELLVRDTIIDARRAFVARYRSRYDGSKYLYSYSFAWSDSTPLFVTMLNNGRSKLECDVSFAAGRAKAHTGGQPIGEAEAGIPDFALSAYLSSRTLRGGDTLRLTVIRCGPDWPKPFTAQTVSAIVSDNSAESAWSITGDTSYAFVVSISKKDRSILSVRLPQGTVGYQVDTLKR